MGSSCSAPQSPTAREASTRLHIIIDESSSTNDERPEGEKAQPQIPQPQGIADQAPRQLLKNEEKDEGSARKMMPVDVTTTTKKKKNIQEGIVSIVKQDAPKEVDHPLPVVGRQDKTSSSNSPPSRLFSPVDSPTSEYEKEASTCQQGSEQHVSSSASMLPVDWSSHPLVNRQPTLDTVADNDQVYTRTPSCFSFCGSCSPFSGGVGAATDTSQQLANRELYPQLTQHYVAECEEDENNDNHNGPLINWHKPPNFLLSESFAEEEQHFVSVDTSGSGRDLFSFASRPLTPGDIHSCVEDAGENAEIDGASPTRSVSGDDHSTISKKLCLPIFVGTNNMPAAASTSCESRGDESILYSDYVANTGDMVRLLQRKKKNNEEEEEKNCCNTNQTTNATNNVTTTTKRSYSSSSSPRHANSFFYHVEIVSQPSDILLSPICATPH